MTGKGVAAAVEHTSTASGAHHRFYLSFSVALLIWLTNINATLEECPFFYADALRKDIARD